MMKKIKLLSYIILVIVMVLFGMLSSFASVDKDSYERASQSGIFQELTFEEEDGFTTVITDIYGNKNGFSGVLEVSDLDSHPCVEKIASYEIFYHGDSVLTVELHDVEADTSELSKDETDTTNLLMKEANTSSSISPSTNGYYSVDFNVTVDGESCEAFITGLVNSEDSTTGIAAVQNEILRLAAKNTSYNQTFYLTKVSFIDTEKIKNAPGSNLCWAAAASNVLHFTGWADKAVSAGNNKNVQSTTVNLKDEDDIFDVFCGAFKDLGGSAENGIGWFFDGVDANKTVISGEHDYTYGKFTGFLPEYRSTMQYTKTGTSCSELNRTFELLREGNGVTISAGYYLPEEEGGTTTREYGHALTLWGFIINPSKKINDPERYKSIIFSDSDNNVDEYSDRREAVNRLGMTKLKFESHYIDSWTPVNMWKMDQYSTKYNVLINYFCVLSKFDDSIQKEMVGTMNLFNNVNFEPAYAVATNGYKSNLDGDNAGSYRQTDFKPGDDIYLFYGMKNTSETLGNLQSGGGVYNKITVYKGSSNIKTVNDYNTVYLSSASETNNLYYQIGRNLEPGNYTAIIELNDYSNSKNKTKEAYYIDNTVTVYFSVLGDYYEKAERESDTVKVRFIPENSGSYIVAGYAEDGKMLGVKIFESASNETENSCTFNDASNITEVKIFHVNSAFSPVGIVKRVEVVS